MLWFAVPQYSVVFIDIFKKKKEKIRKRKKKKKKKKKKKRKKNYIQNNNKRPFRTTTKVRTKTTIHKRISPAHQGAPSNVEQTLINTI